MKRILISAALLLMPGFAMGMDVYDFITAARRNNDIGVYRFLANGGNVNARSSDGCGRTALQTAALHGRTNVMKILLACDIDINLVNAMNDTALHHAVLDGNIETVTLLCDRNDILPSLDAANIHDETPHALAVRLGRMDIANILEDTRRRLTSLVKGIPTGE